MAVSPFSLEYCGWIDGVFFPPDDCRQPANISSNLMTNEMSTTDEYETLYFSTLSWRWSGEQLWNNVTVMKCPTWLI